MKRYSSPPGFVSTFKNGTASGSKADTREATETRAGTGTQGKAGTGKG